MCCGTDVRQVRREWRAMQSACIAPTADRVCEGAFTCVSFQLFGRPRACYHAAGELIEAMRRHFGASRGTGLPRVEVHACVAACT